MLYIKLLSPSFRRALINCAFFLALMISPLALLATVSSGAVGIIYALTALSRAPDESSVPPQSQSNLTVLETESSSLVDEQTALYYAQGGTGFFTNAQVVIIGENHRSLADLVHFIGFLENHLGSDDALLLEGIEGVLNPSQVYEWLLKKLETHQKKLSSQEYQSLVQRVRNLDLKKIRYLGGWDSLRRRRTFDREATGEHGISNEIGAADMVRNGQAALDNGAQRVVIYAGLSHVPGYEKKSDKYVQVLQQWLGKLTKKYTIMLPLRVVKRYQ